jgi:hypothetical protein
MFIVEDGTGKVDANSYCSVAFANTYFTERANETWVDTDTDKKQAALIKATDYIELRYSTLFAGTRMYPDNPQALSFPRYDASSTPLGVPVAIQKATCEYAIRALTAELTSDYSNEVGVNTRIKVGSIEKETSYPTKIISQKVYKSYPAADKLVGLYLKSNSSQVIR